MLSDGGEGIGAGGAGVSSACATPTNDPIMARELTREPTARRRQVIFDVFIILLLVQSVSRMSELSHLTARFNLAEAARDGLAIRRPARLTLSCASKFAVDQ